MDQKISESDVLSHGFCSSRKKGQTLRQSKIQLCPPQMNSLDLVTLVEAHDRGAESKQIHPHRQCCNHHSITRHVPSCYPKQICICYWHCAKLSVWLKPLFLLTQRAWETNINTSSVTVQCSTAFAPNGASDQETALFKNNNDHKPFL